ncbi:MAG: hypothetical protein IJX19_10305, partial [Clostridia bacterium]|nr:hypothetical protein [Clostridia bacterium]
HQLGVKVLVKLFQKLARWRLRKPPRAPQSAKLPNGAFLFVSFFFCAYLVKRKSGYGRLENQKSLPLKRSH